MTQQPRHTLTNRPNTSTREQSKPLQGVYGSGGSYGAGGGFAEDEPGSRVEQEGEGAQREDEGGQALPDVHTRDSEMNDEVLREARRADQARKAADKRAQRGPGTDPRR